MSCCWAIVYTFVVALSSKESRGLKDQNSYLLWVGRSRWSPCYTGVTTFLSSRPLAQGREQAAKRTKR